MTQRHMPGHHGRGMEATGPLVPPGQGHQEIVATASDDVTRKALKADADFTQRTTRRLMSQREQEIEDGDVCLTPAMRKNMIETGEMKK